MASGVSRNFLENVLTEYFLDNMTSASEASRKKKIKDKFSHCILNIFLDNIIRTASGACRFF